MCNFGGKPDMSGYYAAIASTPTAPTMPVIAPPPPPEQAAQSTDLTGIYNMNVPKAKGTQLTAIGGVDPSALPLAYKTLLG